MARATGKVTPNIPKAIAPWATAERVRSVATFNFGVFGSISAVLIYGLNAKTQR